MKIKFDMLVLKVLTVVGIFLGFVLHQKALIPLSKQELSVVASFNNEYLIPCCISSALKNSFS